MNLLVLCLGLVETSAMFLGDPSLVMLVMLWLVFLRPASYVPRHFKWHLRILCVTGVIAKSAMLTSDWEGGGGHFCMAPSILDCLQGSNVAWARPSSVLQGR